MDAFTILEAAQRERRHPNTISRALRSGRLEGHKTRHGWIILERALEVYRDRQAEAAAEVRSAAARKAAQARWAPTKTRLADPQTVTIIDACRDVEGRRE